MPAEHSPLRIWMLADQKPGHMSQLRGLAERLAVHTAVDVRWVDVTKLSWHIHHWLLKRWPESTDNGIPDVATAPELVVGAGSASHAFILLARRVFGCMAVVLMRPSLPLFLFDAAIVPHHDHPPSKENILVTRGVMNTVQPHNPAEPGIAHTMLIGGISKHFDWSSAQIVSQISQIANARPEIRWTITNSRRTPEDFPVLLQKAALPQVAFHPHETTSRDWLPAQLAKSTHVWVTPDSVSMVYEAITAGAATGLLCLEPLEKGRIHEGLDDIQIRGLCTSFERWAQTHTLTPPKERLWEAERGAIWLLQKLQKKRTLHARS